MCTIPFHFRQSVTHGGIRRGHEDESKRTPFSKFQIQTLSWPSWNFTFTEFTCSSMWRRKSLSHVHKILPASFRKKLSHLKTQKIRDLDIANFHTNSPLSVAEKTDQDVPWKTTLLGALYLEFFLTTTRNFLTNTLRTPSSQFFRSTDLHSELSEEYVSGHHVTPCWFVIFEDYCKW